MTIRSLPPPFTLPLLAHHTVSTEAQPSLQGCEKKKPTAAAVVMETEGCRLSPPTN